MTIACLGWGSLIWDPQTLPVTALDWCHDGPCLPVEFSRLSSDDRVTLVLRDEGPACPVLWCALPFLSLDAAVEALRLREGRTRAEWIGRWPCDHGQRFLHGQVIARWAHAQGLDGAVWTAIPPKWNDRNGETPTLDLVVAHLRSLDGERVRRAIEYIQRVPAQIRTPFRERLEVVAGEIAERAIERDKRVP